MNKKVLVIGDEDLRTLSDSLCLLTDPKTSVFATLQIARRCLVVLNKALPGNLLAEFEGYTDKIEIDRFASEKDEGQLFQMWKRKKVCGADMDGPFTVLILDGGKK